MLVWLAIFKWTAIMQEGVLCTSEINSFEAVKYWIS